MTKRSASVVMQHRMHDADAAEAEMERLPCQCVCVDARFGRSGVCIRRVVLATSDNAGCKVVKSG